MARILGFVTQCFFTFIFTGFMGNLADSINLNREFSVIFMAWGSIAGWLGLKTVTGFLGIFAISLGDKFGRGVTEAWLFSSFALWIYLYMPQIVSVIKLFS